MGKYIIEPAAETHAAFRHKDGREFMIPVSEVSGDKLEKWKLEGFTQIAMHWESNEVMKSKLKAGLDQLARKVNPNKDIYK